MFYTFTKNIKTTKTTKNINVKKPFLALLLRIKNAVLFVLVRLDNFKFCCFLRKNATYKKA